MVLDSRRRKRAADTRPGRAWFSRAEMSAIFGVSEVHFDRHVRSLAAGKDVKKKGRRVWFRARGLVNAFVAREIEKHTPPSASQEPGKAQKGAKSNGAQERLRTAKADLEELKLARERRESIPREEIHGTLGRLAVILRGAGEVLQREFGKEAQAVLDAALDEFEEAVKKSYGNSDHATSD